MIRHRTLDLIKHFEDCKSDNGIQYESFEFSIRCFSRVLSSLSAKRTLETIINGVFTPHSAGATSMGREKCSNFYKSFTNTVLYRFESNPNATCNTMRPMPLFWICMFYHYTCSLIELCQTFTILFSSTVWISWEIFFFCI